MLGRELERGFGARIREERSKSGLNQADFGKLAGVSDGSQVAYEKGKTPPPSSYLFRLADHGVDIVYILSGHRSNIADQLAKPAVRQLRGVITPNLHLADRMIGNQKIPPNQHLPRFGNNSANDDLVDVAEIDLRYGLGGTFIDDESIETEQRQFSGAWLRKITDSPPSMLFWSRGQGNSMSPTIEDGEIVLGDRSQTKPLTDDLIWACALGEIGMIKRLRIRPHHVKLLSDNALVPDDTVHPDDNLRIVGRIIAVVKNL